MKKKRELVTLNPNPEKEGFVCDSPDKTKMWGSESEEDEFFAALGYNVKSSDMVDVARKIHQIDMAMGSDDDLSQLVSTETVHRNPADLYSWLGSMLNTLPQIPSPPLSTVNAFVDLDFGSDLGSIPGKAVYPPEKKVKTTPSSVQETRSVVVDSQENGIKLVHSLMACAEAVQEKNFNVAEALLKKVVFFAVSQDGAMRKVANYFAEALAKRIYSWKSMAKVDSLPFSDTNLLRMHFYETCPYLKFAHFTANQAILEAFAGKKRVHIIDFSIDHGMQWPPLLLALATRNGGAPTLRLTGIASPSHNDLQSVELTLAEYASTFKIELDFRTFVMNSLSDLNPSMFELREDEALAVNSILDLHQLLAKPGAIDKLLQLVQHLNPLIFTVAEQEVNHNSNIFLDRFTEALHYYSTLFDSLESCGSDSGDNLNKIMSEVYLGQEIHNVVAEQGVNRVERHETLSQWRTRLDSHGFQPVHHGSDVYKMANDVVALYGGQGYTVTENDGCLMLGWHMRPLIAASAWIRRRSNFRSIDFLNGDE